MTNEELKQKMLEAIIRRTKGGVGARTTEVEDVWREAAGLVKPRAGYNDGSPEAQTYYGTYPERGLPKKLVLELHAEGKIVWYDRGGYCWMLPSSYSQFYRVGQIINQPFDLW